MTFPDSEREKKREREEKRKNPAESQMKSPRLPHLSSPGLKGSRWPTSWHPTNAWCDSDAKTEEGQVRAHSRVPLASGLSDCMADVLREISLSDISCCCNLHLITVIYQKMPPPPSHIHTPKKIKASWLMSESEKNPF